MEEVKNIYYDHSLNLSLDKQTMDERLDKLYKCLNLYDGEVFDALRNIGFYDKDYDFVIRISSIQALNLYRRGLINSVIYEKIIKQFEKEIEIYKKVCEIKKEDMKFKFNRETIDNDTDNGWQSCIKIYKEDLL
jgi:hypothetical protein